jgi:hypothetical protein
MHDFIQLMPGLNIFIDYIMPPKLRIQRGYLKRRTLPGTYSLAILISRHKIRVVLHRNDTRP